MYPWKAPWWSSPPPTLSLINSLSRLANGQINFEKFWQLAKQVKEFMGWQQVQCSFPKVQSVTSVLQMPPVLLEKSKQSPLA